MENGVGVEVFKTRFRNAVNDTVFKLFMKGVGVDSAKVHELKTDPEPYNDLVENRKTHTVRVDDRMYIEGDYVILRKTKYTGAAMAQKAPADTFPLIYSGLSTLCKITNVYSGPGLAEGFVVLSLKIIDRFPGRVG